MKKKSSESKIETKLEVKKGEKTEKLEKKEDRRQIPSVKSRTFGGSTPVEAFCSNLGRVAQYYKWTEDEISVQMKYALSGAAATLVWSQVNPDQLTVSQLHELLREIYRSAKHEEKFQDELRARRRKANEDLPTLRSDIS